MEITLLDIKPYIPELEAPTDVQIGWLEKARDKVKEKRSDPRINIDN